MKGKNTEKKVYELLGVNIFRKYVLGTYEKFLNLVGLKDVYKIKDCSIEGLKNYKANSKNRAIQHIIQFVGISALYTTIALSGTLSPMLLTIWTANSLIDIYSIMTQRYHHIRINEILEKQEKLQKRREERQQETDESNSQIEKANSIDLVQSNLAEKHDEKSPHVTADLLKTTRDELLAYTNNQPSTIPNENMVACSIVSPVTEKGFCLSKKI